MKRRRLGRHATGVLAFFLLIAVVIQTAVLVYEYISSRTENKWIIALLMLLVGGLLAVLCTAIDALRRKYIVERPANLILRATERMARGDFSVRIPVVNRGSYTQYDRIIENVNLLAEELGKMEGLKTDFLSNVSHELKTPLSVIRNYAELLGEDGVDEETRKQSVSALARATERLIGLVDGVLKLNKLENQGLRPPLERVNVTAVLSECVLAFERTVEEKEIVLSCDLDDVYGDSVSSYLEIVFQNLLSNAIKFTPNGGSVSVSLKRRGADAVVRVSDTGCGISPDTGERIFEKFYQEDASHSHEGNGLGLALVKKVVDLLGGSISVESELGKGSTFTVLLKGEEREGSLE